MIRKGNKIILKNKEYLFWLAYVIYIAELLFFSSMYGEFDSLQTLFAGVRSITYLLICTKIVMDFFYKEYDKKELVFIGAITILLLLSAKIIGNKAMFIYWVFIIAAHNIELEKIVKATIIVHLCCMFIIIASYIGGVVENRIYIQEGGRSRASLGYQYTTDSSNYFFHIILMYIYIKKEKISWESIGTLMLCNLLLFELTDTKNAFILGTFVLIIAGVMKIFKCLRNNNIVYKAGAIFAMPLASGTIIYLSFLFNEQVRWMKELDTLFSGRLTMGYNAFKTYGISVWGKAIQWIGGTRNYMKNPGEYNYVDSSYTQILINYGVLIFILVCFLFVLLSWRASKKNDVYLMLVLVIISLHSFLDPQLLWMGFNPFIMCYSYLIKKDSLAVMS